MATLEEVSQLIRDAVTGINSRVANDLNQIRTELQQIQPPRVTPFLPVAIYPNIPNNGTSLHLIKSLPEFKGEASEYPPWREAAHFAMRYYNEGSENYYIAMGILRNKITGAANVALSSFNTILNFYAIIERLDQSYSDKRPIHVLESELSVLRQGDLSLQEFYDSVDRQLTLIINKIKMNNNSEEILVALNLRARENALRVFISGLRRPLCDILFSSKPNDLASALAIAQELEFNQKRQEFAKAFSTNKKTNVHQFSNFQAPINNRFSSNLNNNFRANDVNNNASTSNSNNNIRPQNSNNSWRSKQEPMDVDPGSSFFRRQKTQPSNRLQQLPGSERIKSVRRTPFSPQKFQALNHLPVGADDCSVNEDHDCDNNELLDEISTTSEEEINFLDKPLSCLL